MPKRVLRFLPSLSVLATMLALTMMIVHAANRSGPLIPGQDPLDSSPPPDAPAAFTTTLGNAAEFNGSNYDAICPQNISSPGDLGLPDDITAGCGNNGLSVRNDFFADKAVFEEQVTIEKGLGPVYNEKSCVNCHQGPVSGGAAHVAELRVGDTNNLTGAFINPVVKINYGLDTIPDPNGQNQPRSVINALAINSDCEEATPDSVLNPPTGQTPQQTLRLSLNVLGDGFVEAIYDQTIKDIATSQCTPGSRICGEYIFVPVLENGVTAIGRFGWKDEHASLLSFASDAYLNEIGVTNRLAPNNKDITVSPHCKVTTDPEDHADSGGLFDIDHFARFMRALQAPPREDDEDIDGSGERQSINNGQVLFGVTGSTTPGIGCNTCHVTQIATGHAGTPQGGLNPIPAALGDKTIHPYSDFLLHDIGTGDGIVQNGPQDTAMKIRSAPLWGVHARNRFLHNGTALSVRQAIEAHKNEAQDVIGAFNGLSATQQQDIINFVNSL